MDCRIKPGNDSRDTANAGEQRMSDNFLKNPASLFDIKGKTAIVTGATGALGALAAKVFAGAGANVVTPPCRWAACSCASRIEA